MSPERISGASGGFQLRWLEKGCGVETEWYACFLLWTIVSVFFSGGGPSAFYAHTRV